MTETLRPLSDDDRPVVERLWQLYAHDLSEFRGSMPDAEGRYRAGRLPGYFGDDDRCGYLVLSDGAPAGFALVRGLDAESRVVGEFFVVRAVRRRGVGRRAAAELLRRHPGRWQIPFQEENPGAARFWRRVAADLAGADLAGATWQEERRPVPGKPHVPADVWLTLTV